MAFKIVKQVSGGNWLKIDSSNCVFCVEIHKDQVLGRIFLTTLT